MVTTDLSRIEKRIHLRAPQAKVWRAITSGKEFSKWFGVEMEGEGEFAPGAQIWMVTTMEGYAGMRFWVTVEKMEPERLFSWRWHPGAVDPNVDYSKEPTTLVEFHLEAGDGGTWVTVMETGFDQIPLERRAAVYKDNQGGWEYQMKSLTSYVGEG